MYFVMFYRSFVIISSWILLSKKGRIQFTALPWESVHVLCFLLLKRIHVLCPFRPLDSLFTSYYFKLIAKLLAYLASWDNLCHWFNLSTHVVPWSHTAQKTQSFIKIPLSYLFTSLKSVFIIGHLRPYWTSFDEIDSERALSCPHRASYEAERGLVLFFFCLISA